MYDINQAGYDSLQNYINNNIEEAKASTKKNQEIAAYCIAWPTIIKNIAIALTGLGLLLISAKLIYSKIREGRSLFFFQKPKTTSAEKNISDKTIN